LITILLLTFGVGANGQEFDEESNGIKSIGKGDTTLTLRFDFSRYSKGDLENAKAKFPANFLDNDGR
jgi:hypothetical protein